MYGISVNTHQNQKVEKVAGGSPRVVAGSPTTATTASPRHFFGSPKAKGSPKTAEVGEIDTRAPFQSVKAAVSLFGEAGASPRSPAAYALKKTNKSADERVVEKESELHLALNQLDAYKIQLRNSEATKAQALRDLEDARTTLQHLSSKIGTINPSDQPPTGTAAPPRRRETDQQHINAAELNSVKQQLAQLRRDFDSAMEAKTAAIHKASRAQNSAVVNRERVLELSKEVASFREALAKLTSLHSQEEHAKAIAAKQASLKSLQKAKEDAEAKMQAINQEFDPDLTQHLKLKLDQTNKEIEVLREKLKNAKSADMNAWKTAASELETAKKAMQEVVSLENSLRSQVDSLQQELENSPDKSKNNPSKEELRATIKEDTKDDDSDYIASKILQLTSEAELAIREAEEMKSYAESFRKEAEIARIAAKEAEEKLESVLKEAKEARTIRLADSSRTGDPAISKLNGKIKLSKDEYESLKKKIDQTKKLPESKSKRMSITSCPSGCF